MNTNLALNIGTELNGQSVKYKITDILGQGSFGVTYKAKAYTTMKGAFGEEVIELPIPKAIKEFFMRDINSRSENGSITALTEGGIAYNYAQKFRKEAENLARMNHPNIVKVIDFIEANNTYYYVMDYIEGQNLNEYIKSNKLSEKEVCSIINSVAGGLIYMHDSEHMLHLDLKPGNIMRRSSDGHIFIIDFGLSKHYNEAGLPDTSTTVGLGTEGYAPIEQGKKSKTANEFLPTIDVYALGATLFKLLTGKTPLASSDILNDEDFLPTELSKANVSKQIQKVIIEAMCPIAKKRTPTVCAFINAFNATFAFVVPNTKNSETEEHTIILPEKNTQNTSGNAESTTLEAHTSTPRVKKAIAIHTTPTPQKENKSKNYNHIIGICAGIIFLLGITIATILVYHFSKNEDKYDWDFDEDEIEVNSLDAVEDENLEYTDARSAPTEVYETPDIQVKTETKANHEENAASNLSSETTISNETAQKSSTVQTPVMEYPQENNETVNDDEIFEVVEQQPAFPGGFDKLMQWLSLNLKYPTSAQENGTQGRVIVQFVVNKDGSIVEPKVVKSVDPALDMEAIRVVSNMPKWSPGKHRGKNVRVRFTLPVTFRLQ